MNSSFVVAQVSAGSNPTVLESLIWLAICAVVVTAVLLMTKWTRSLGVPAPDENAYFVITRSGRYLGPFDKPRAEVTATKWGATSLLEVSPDPGAAHIEIPFNAHAAFSGN